MFSYNRRIVSAQKHKRKQLTGSDIAVKSCEGIADVLRFNFLACFAWYVGLT